MKNILFYIPSFAGGGAERVASVMLNHWHNVERYNIKVVNTVDESKDLFKIDPGIARYNLSFNYNVNGFKKILEKCKRFYKLRSSIKNNESEIVITFLTYPSILLLISSIGLNKKVICCEHNNYYAVDKKLIRVLRNILFYFFAHKITVLTHEDIYNYPKLLQGKIIVLPNPLGIDGRVHTLEKHDDKLVRLLFVGRLTRQKGIDRLCRIIQSLDSHNWILNVCGDGELRPELESFIKNNNFQSKIFLRGNVENIADFYKSSDLLVMTSYWEGLPMVLAEAMSFGVPAIGFDCPTGPKKFITSYKTGYLVDNGNESHFATKLDEFISNKKVLKSYYTECLLVSSFYSIDNIQKVWLKILCE
ncbi:glycosyltransferase family 4 protein [Cobetia sp. 1CM21F]|uniref:glycosyltransferase family 4 protein n=1 Tax=Cobetia sp. 1CM21F TaxID=2929163 RepID=UPI0020BE9AD8|nr:glycosyltransferase family 4 protein [Cobetia sp. 1CM21F]MCK8066923.1 glycosyltransferase family 4 protein [Cobetia sp. 1CM21F]